MIAEERIKEATRIVRVRRKLLNEAETELMNCIEEVMAESRQKANDRKLKVKEIATLLGKSEPTIWRWGVNKISTYYQLWEWVKEHKPQYLKRLEDNYKRHLKDNQNDK